MAHFFKSTEFKTVTKAISTPTYFNHSTFGKLKLNSLTHKHNCDDTISYNANVTDSTNRTFIISIPYCLYINHSITNDEFDFISTFINELIDYPYNPPYPFEDEYGPFYSMIDNYFHCPKSSD